jgi:hypothetical protein
MPTAASRTFWAREACRLTVFCFFESGRIRAPACPQGRTARGPGFTLVSFLPPAKKDTASIPCAAVKRHPCRFTALSFCGAKTHKSPQPASMPACLRQTPSIRRWRIAMETAASMPQVSGTKFIGFFNHEVEKVEEVE